MVETIIAMISGGVDSTYMLYKLLTETNNHIHAHHIHIKNNIEPRWKKEHEAVIKILAYCRYNYRDFDYSESTFEFYNFGHVGSDSALQLFIGARVALNLKGKKVSIAIGCNKDEYNDYQQTRMQFGLLEGSNTKMLKAAINYFS